MTVAKSLIVEGTVISSEGYSNLDEVYQSIKPYGYYQIFFLLVTQWACWTQAANGVSGFFSLGGLIPHYICQDNDLDFHLTPEGIRRNTSESCALIKRCRNLTTTNAWFSIYEEFDWVCQPDYLASTIYSLLPIITLLSYTISGHLSDYFGRKWLCVCGFGLSLASGFLMAFAPNWQFYFVLVVLNAFIHTIASGAWFSLAVECVHSKHRLIQSFGFQYSIGYILAGLSGYFLGNWRRQLLLMNSIGVPALILMFFFVESPRFLIQRGNYSKATKVINKMAKFNKVEGKSFTHNEIQMIHLSTPSTKKHSFIHLFTANRRLTLYAISQIITGLSMNLVGTVMSYNIQDLSGNPFINVALMGLLRVWTPFFSIALEKGYTEFGGRKKLYVCSQTVVCLSFLIMLAVDSFEMGERARVIGTGAVLIGFIVQSGIVWVCYKLYTAELFPTVIRTIALSTFSCTSLIGSVIGPQLIYLKKYWHSTPYAGAFLSTTLAVLLATLLLPETKSHSLTDTLHESVKTKVRKHKENEDIVQVENEQKLLAIVKQEKGK